ncbi:protein ANTAGONIST OF LIKE HETEROCHROMATIN PROTEIN 1-like [Temnothorax curvispinosus]|uniref:Protein ANTAGONIST OF LIKE HETEROCHROMATIN PROTEIN 1-like n=1 Tax=Temnothorax curvispinosus TaxID=300111 RepID=A0A6J1QJ54_9HYME|nr:protein ANTAGONIST OF LIKE HETEROCHROMATIN PROTEIN 1-like [Temnothorax curvispinosus]
MRRIQLGDYNNLFQEIKNDPQLFYRYTRMTLVHFQKLVQMTKPYLTKKSPRALVPELRLLITLRYLATGDLPITIALAFRVGESTVREVVKEVCHVLYKVLDPLYLSSPTEEDWRKYAHGYWNRWNIPNCVGSVDGKHVRLRCPPRSGSLYFNYKKFYSIVLLAVADHLYRFVLVDIGAYGGNSDGGIFNDCNIGTNLSNNTLNLPNEQINLPNSNLKTYTYFVADDAFKLSKRIMKPYSSKNLMYKQRIFNYRLSRARRTVESAFGIFSNKWRIFHTAISMLPETADLIVTASVCLHNYVLKEEQQNGHKMYSQEPSFKDNTNESSPWINIPSNFEEDNDVRYAENQRNTLSNYFISEAGKVEWQHDYVQRGVYADE